MMLSQATAETPLHEEREAIVVRRNSHALADIGYCLRDAAARPSVGLPPAPVVRQVHSA